MHLRRILNSQKAVAAILIILILIVSAVATVIVTYACITSYAANSEQAEVKPFKSEATFCGANTITIAIGNSGTGNSEIIEVHVGTSESTLQNQQTNPSIPIALNAGSIASFNVSYSWTAGETYYFKIVTKTGTPYTFNEQAPQ